MRLLLVTTQVPFVYGGAEVLASDLKAALLSAGHEAEIVQIPFQPYPPELILDHMLACRLIPLHEACGKGIDRVIGLKFPAYLAPHHDKVMWLLHQHRTAYDLWDSPHCEIRGSRRSAEIRQAIWNADTRAFQECKAVYTISKNVSQRLMGFNGIRSEALYPPPRNAQLYHGRPALQKDQAYFYFPSRINPLKRQSLAIEALTKTRHPVKLVFAGTPDHPAYLTELEDAITRHGLRSRVTLQGSIDEPTKIRTYCESLGVVYLPFDEDYGYVTVEGMLAGKPIVTTSDSGGPTEFVRHGSTGLITEPTAEALAQALDSLWENREHAERLGRAGRELFDSLDITWPHVLRGLLG